MAHPVVCVGDGRVYGAFLLHCICLLACWFVVHRVAAHGLTHSWPPPPPPSSMLDCCTNTTLIHDHESPPPPPSFHTHTHKPNPYNHNDPQSTPPSWPGCSAGTRLAPPRACRCKLGSSGRCWPMPLLLEKEEGRRRRRRWGRRWSGPSRLRPSWPRGTWPGWRTRWRRRRRGAGAGRASKGWGTVLPWLCE